MGLSMLAIGMVASFLTPNLTVSFILAALFNAIPVMTYYADVLIPASISRPANFAMEFRRPVRRFRSRRDQLVVDRVLRADHRARHLSQHGADR